VGDVVVLKPGCGLSKLEGQIGNATTLLVKSIRSALPPVLGFMIRDKYVGRIKAGFDFWGSIVC